MLFTATLMASVALLVPTTFAQSDSPLPSCVTDCFNEFPTSSWCDGDETGEDLAECTCQSLRGSNLLNCIYDCSDEDQNDYAQVLVGSCKKELFPDATDDSGDDETNDDAETSTTTGGSSDPTTTTGDAQPSQTEQDNGDGEGAAMGLDVPAALAAGGLVAAFFL